MGFLCLLAAITYLDRVAISVAGPRMQESLNISPEMWGWVVGIFTISYALFERPTGRMGDRIGARRVLTRVVLWRSAFTAFTGMASNYYVLLLTRFCFGAGEAGALPNIGVSLSRWFPVIERARAMGFICSCKSVAPSPRWSLCRSRCALAGALRFTCWAWLASSGASPGIGGIGTRRRKKKT